MQSKNQDNSNRNTYTDKDICLDIEKLLNTMKDVHLDKLTVEDMINLNYLSNILFLQKPLYRDQFEKTCYILRLYNESLEIGIFNL